jgi:hypothetical protein
MPQSYNAPVMTALDQMFLMALWWGKGANDFVRNDDTEHLLDLAQLNTHNQSSGSCWLPFPHVRHTELCVFLVPTCKKTGLPSARLVELKLGAALAHTC